MKKMFLINMAIIFIVNIFLFEKLYCAHENIEFNKEEKQFIKELQKKKGVLRL
jgi:hypothetical protein